MIVGKRKELHRGRRCIAVCKQSPRMIDATICRGDHEKPTFRGRLVPQTKNKHAIQTSHLTHIERTEHDLTHAIIDHDLHALINLRRGIKRLAQTVDAAFCTAGRAHIRACIPNPNRHTAELTLIRLRGLMRHELKRAIFVAPARMRGVRLGGCRNGWWGASTGHEKACEREERALHFSTLRQEEGLAVERVEVECGANRMQREFTRERHGIAPLIRVALAPKYLHMLLIA